MAKTIRILGVHGLGDHRQSKWKEEWEACIRRLLPEPVTLEFDFVVYDDIFEKTKLGIGDTLEAAAKLLGSGLGSFFRPRKGFLDPASDRIRWTAGYVVAWTAEKSFQEKTRKRVLDKVAAFKPDLILAHSLGSLVTYNAFSHRDATDNPEMAKLLRNARYVTLGSQIGNPFVVGNLTNGRVMPLGVKHWHHLFNPNDKVFTAPLVLQSADNFTQIVTDFDLKDDHAAPNYFEHAATVANLWDPLEADAAGAKVFGLKGFEAALAVNKTGPSPSKRRRRALLVGINEYADPGQNLEGCVNDVFAMSATLQQCGFDPEDIRVCLNERATAEGILSRLGWLLEDAKDGDERVFYYSGHGAQIPDYGPDGTVNHKVETLVPHDFDWSPDRWVSDQQIMTLYSQLPDDCRFVMILDCCHSGGMHRDGGARPRGITPPDDIRHRALKWDIDAEMWVERGFQRINQEFAPKKDAVLTEQFYGKDGATLRLGRAGSIRPLRSRDYEALKKENPEMARGAYLPLIIEACGPDQLSYEYRHGATSYGAFTFCLTSILKDEAKGGRGPTFESVVQKATKRLGELRYDQTPVILGPRHITQAAVPFLVR